jgi:FAD/FMN-containing dehydrogenase
MDFPSWGRFPEVTQRAHHLRWRDDLRLPTGNDTLLPYGQGRSYGDCCLNSGGTILVTQGLNRFIEFDEASGMLHAESGVTLADILEMAVPRGWFLPVTPGTKFVSLGGAIANDVHGKNHHCAGNFGRYVKGFELLRSDGKRYQCSSTENADLYRATIAGLGLTGLITAATLQLKKIAGPRIDAEDIKFGSLAEFFEISSDSAARFEYTVAWLDCVSSGKNFGRGIFMRGNHADSEIPTRKKTIWFSRRTV